MADPFADLSAALAQQAPAAPAATPPTPGIAALPVALPADFSIFTAPDSTVAPAAPTLPVAALPVAVAPATGVDTATLAQAVLAMQQQNAMMMQYMQQAQQAQQEPQPAAPAAPPELPAIDAMSMLSPTEQQQYGDMAPILSRIVSQAVQAATGHLTHHFIAPLQAQVAQTRADLQGTNDAAQQASSRAMASALQAAVPDLAAIIHTPGWQAKLKERIPFTVDTVGSALVRAYTAGDMAVIREQVAAFSRANKPVVPPLAAPVGSSAAMLGVPLLPGSGGAAAGTVDWNKVNDVVNRHAAGQITHDAYNAMLEQATMAAVNGAAIAH